VIEGVRGPSGPRLFTAGLPSAPEILEAMTPPLTDTSRRTYRAYVRPRLQGMAWEDLRRLIVYFGCSIADVETRIVNWQYDRARQRAAERREVERRARKQEAVR
jgi:hypothetical protein